jgi:heme exporter protein CcmD
MIPYLGKYHNEVLASFAATFVLLMILVGFSVMRSRRVARDLAEVEARRKKTNV